MLCITNYFTDNLVEGINMDMSIFDKKSGLLNKIESRKDLTQDEVKIAVIELVVYISNKFPKLLNGVDVKTLSEELAKGLLSKEPLAFDRFIQLLKATSKLEATNAIEPMLSIQSIKESVIRFLSEDELNETITECLDSVLKEINS